MQQLAYKAYGEVTSRTANNGQIEYALFDEITQALKSVDQDEMPSPAVWGDEKVRQGQEARYDRSVGRSPGSDPRKVRLLGLTCGSGAR